MLVRRRAEGGSSSVEEEGRGRFEPKGIREDGVAAGTADGGRARDDVMDGLRVGSVEGGGGRRSMAAVLRCLLLLLMASRGQEGTRTETVGGSRAELRIDSEESASEGPHGPPRVRPRTAESFQRRQQTAMASSAHIHLTPAPAGRFPGASSSITRLSEGSLTVAVLVLRLPSLHLVCRASTQPATVSPALERE